MKPRPKSRPIAFWNIFLDAILTPKTYLSKGSDEGAVFLETKTGDFQENPAVR